MERIRFPTLIDFIFPKIENRVLNLVKEVILIFSFSVLTGICSKLKIEIGPIPITMQTFAVLLTGAILGSKRGALSQLTYLLFGLFGVPWFARGGGISYIMSPTFGYIVGFVFCAFLVGFLCEKGSDRKILTCVLAMFFGNIILYIPGLLWLAKFVGFDKVLEVGFFPFMAGDLIKIFLAGLTLPFLWRILKVKNRN
jgi:biotin transporter BioY